MQGEILAGRYAIQRPLGEGAMGCVYEARHTGTNRRVAVKVISGDLSKHPSIVARFQIEARATGAIDSTHIAQVLDVGEDPDRGVPYLVMEFLNGEDLAQLLKRVGPLPPELVARIAAQACIGLSRAHAAQIVHRDIKPGNMFVARRDEGDHVIKLLDFGIAKMRQPDQGNDGMSLTRTGNLIGTPLYMSPEQARGDKIIDERADIWSLGVVLYQLLCGNTPHHNIDALGQLIIQICSVPARPLAEVAPWTPPELTAVVEKCLEIDPAMRFQTAEEILRDLRPLLPNGFAIEDAMLVPLSEEQRQSRPAALPVRAGSIPGTDPGHQARSVMPPASPEAVLTTGAVSADKSAPSVPVVPKSNRNAFVLVALAGIAAATFAVYRFTTPGVATMPAPTAPPMMTARVVAEPTKVPAAPVEPPVAESASTEAAASAAPPSSAEPVVTPSASAADAPSTDATAPASTGRAHHKSAASTTAPPPVKSRSKAHDPTRSM